MFQSPSCGAVFGTFGLVVMALLHWVFQSPSCGAVFGTSCRLAATPPAPTVSVAFMRRGVRDKKLLLRLSHLKLAVSVAFMRRGVRDDEADDAAAFFFAFQSPSCGAVFGTR